MWPSVLKLWASWGGLQVPMCPESILQVCGFHRAVSQWTPQFSITSSSVSPSAPPEANLSGSLSSTEPSPISRAWVGSNSIKPMQELKTILAVPQDWLLLGWKSRTRWLVFSTAPGDHTEKDFLSQKPLTISSYIENGMEASGSFRFAQTCEFP